MLSKHIVLAISILTTSPNSIAWNAIGNPYPPYITTEKDALILHFNSNRSTWSFNPNGGNTTWGTWYKGPGQQRSYPVTNIALCVKLELPTASIYEPADSYYLNHPMDRCVTRAAAGTMYYESSAPPVETSELGISNAPAVRFKYTDTGGDRTGTATIQSRVSIQNPGAPSPQPEIGTTFSPGTILSTQYWVQNGIVYFEEPTVSCTIPPAVGTIQSDLQPNEYTNKTIPIDVTCTGAISGTIRLTGSTASAQIATTEDSVARTDAVIVGCDTSVTGCPIAGTVVHVDVEATTTAKTTSGGYLHSFYLTWTLD